MDKTSAPRGTETTLGSPRQFVGSTEPVIPVIAEHPPVPTIELVDPPQPAYLAIRLSGDMSLETVSRLRDPLNALLAERGERSLVLLDLRKVPFLDSAGLGVLVGVKWLLGETAELNLLVAHGSQPERVLNVSRLDALLKVHTSWEDLAA